MYFLCRGAAAPAASGRHGTDLGGGISSATALLLASFFNASGAAIAFVFNNAMGENPEPDGAGAAGVVTFGIAVATVRGADTVVEMVVVVVVTVLVKVKLVTGGRGTGGAVIVLIAPEEPIDAVKEAEKPNDLVVVVDEEVTVADVKVVLAGSGGSEKPNSWRGRARRFLSRFWWRRLWNTLPPRPKENLGNDGRGNDGNVNAGFGSDITNGTLATGFRGAGRTNGGGGSTKPGIFGTAGTSVCGISKS
jgi:hypothetical protein